MISTTSSVLPVSCVSPLPSGVAGNSVRTCSLLAQAMTRHLRKSNRQIKSQFDRESADFDNVKIDNLLKKVSEVLCHSRSDQKPSDQAQSELAVHEFTKHLFALAKQIDQSNVKDATSQNQHARQLLLMPILPLYLRSSSQPLSSALNDATQLMWEHRVLLTLNHSLDGDLMLAIEEDKLQHQSPLSAAEAVLQIELGNVVDACRRSMTSKDDVSKSKSSLTDDTISTPLTSKQRDGYWTIASQWIQQREAISIPADLAVGAVSWARLRKHWNELSECLFSLDNTFKKINPEPMALAMGLDSATIPTVAPEKHNDNIVSGLGKSASSPEHTINIDSHPDIIEIRSSNDPELARNLDVHLQRCRERSGSLALVVVRCKVDQKTNSARGKELLKGTLTSWQLDMIATLQSSLEHRKMYGFHTTDGEIALIMEDVDRSEVTALVRQVIEQEAVVDDEETRLLDQAGLPLYSGIACVNAPSKSFRLTQLTESAWRCLDASMRQPPGAVKSIEVY